MKLSIFQISMYDGEVHTTGNVTLGLSNARGLAPDEGGPPFKHLEAWHPGVGGPPFRGYSDLRLHFVYLKDFAGEAQQVVERGGRLQERSPEEMRRKIC